MLQNKREKMSAKMNSPPSRTDEGEQEKPFIITATVGMTSSSSNRNNTDKIELIARTSTPTFVLKMLLCKEASLNESDYDLRYKGKILPTSDPNTTLKECGITGSCHGISLWENDACRRRKVADELDAIRREKREQFYEKEADARAEARREIERIKAKNSYSPENTTNNGGFGGQATMERQDTSRYGYGTSSSSQRQPTSVAEENPYRQYHQQQQQQRESSPIVIDGSSDDDARNNNYTNSAERRNQHHQNDYQNDSRRHPPPPPPPEIDDLAKRRVASDELQKIIADVDAIKFRVDDILDVHKNDPSLISDDLRKTTLKNAREAAHLLEKSLLRADAVESYGFNDIRAMRKGLVARVENLCGKLEPLTKE